MAMLMHIQRFNSKSNATNSSSSKSEIIEEVSLEII